MLTLFSTAKPFVGHSRVIQRNALQSWKLLHPDAEVILFGNDEGAAETCRDLGLRHEPYVKRNENGTKYLNWIFDKANEYSRHQFLCYANCDIMLGSDFLAALQVVSARHNRFLITGQRWDTDITAPWDFSRPDWGAQLRSLALQKGKQNGPTWLDYFCFTRDLYYRKMPPFLIGRQGLGSLAQLLLPQEPRCAGRRARCGRTPKSRLRLHENRRRLLLQRGRGGIQLAAGRYFLVAFLLPAFGHR